MPRVYNKIKKFFSSQKIIHIVGTNGKGTTGRFLALALYSLGFETAHYTSPHIAEFNERIWCNGQNVCNEDLDKAHEQLQSYLDVKDSNSLSYFEYTTLLAMLIFRDCEYVILEAGLGGEYDATAVFENILTLVTPIDFDHEFFLGTNITQIATTKINAAQKNIIVGKQKHLEVFEIAKQIAQSKKIDSYTIDDLLDADDYVKVQKIANELCLEAYLIENLQLSISALKFLGLNYKVENFKNARMFGRLTKIAKNILIDVGHNPLAASSIVKALSPQKFILVYNTYKDKNYREILQILKPIIQHVEIIAVEEPRIEDSEKIQTVLNELKIQYSYFNEINLESEYLVFGSFSVVEKFLKVINE